MPIHDGRFVVVGFLVPSHSGRSYKVIVNGRFLGLIKTGDLINAARRPMREITICQFTNDETRQTTIGATVP